MESRTTDHETLQLHTFRPVGRRPCRRLSRPASACRRSSSSATVAQGVPHLAEHVCDSHDVGPRSGDRQPLERCVELLPHLRRPRPVAAAASARTARTRPCRPSTGHRTPAASDALSIVAAMCSHELAMRTNPIHIARTRRRVRARVDRLLITGYRLLQQLHRTPVLSVSVAFVSASAPT